jgi:hypothetical protein
MLANLNQCLNKAQAHADAKKFDSTLLVSSRLAPDQFDLGRQIQIACDHAKNGVVRLTGIEAPVFEDTERTLAELETRIEKVSAFLSGVQPKDFANAEGRRISLPRWGGKSLSSTEYAMQYLLPNFYFHTTTAYAILRHNGVDLGKHDFIGELPFKSE